MFKDAHHILHPRQEYSLRPEARSLRENPSLIIRLDRSEHNDIHFHTPGIPLLGYHALIRTRKEYEAGDTPLESVENLMQAIEIAQKHPKAHRIESELAGLAIWSLDLVRPFIAGKEY